MGFIMHHAIVVTSQLDELIEAAHSVATSGGCVVSPIADSPVNSYRSFCVFPDGSKEGWTPSDDGDARRVAFVKWMRAQAYDDGSSSLSFVEVAYGDERAHVVCDDEGALP